MKGINYLTPCTRVLRDEVIVTQLVKKSPAFYGTRRFITVFTRARQLCLSWARWIQSTTSQPSTINLNISSHLRLGLTTGLFPSNSQTKIL